ncbi:unnamed protein product, partial [Mesorhabditis belari]|uniref:G-protein coupled receptors family 1 profile domain-containing protein n=1 Tax=Mesorhabditis belari TaxID=2138241 RepID=A0AAF3EC26_9BILA
MNSTLKSIPRELWDSPYSTTTQIIVWFIVVLLSLETIIGNAMVIMAYKLERNISKQVSNRYIVSLAISDLIIGIEGFPLFTIYFLNGDRWPLGAVTCETWLFLDYTLCLVSILTVLLITADRYLSVCHTAKYLKWQSPTKTQVMIILSWAIPAVVFGIMIYAWKAMTGEAGSMEGDECSAPFLANPYVNMGMYVSYYWTTLVAMLILYKGIHQAAKNLEEKGKAKERRHIALILSQRLGTQVGVSLMLQQDKERERKLELERAERETETRDSAYATQTTAILSSANATDESGGHLEKIDEVLSIEQTPELPRKRLQDHTRVMISFSNGSNNNFSPKRPSTLDDLKSHAQEAEDENTDNEEDSLLGELESTPSRRSSKKRNRSSLRSVKSADTTQSEKEKRKDSLSLLFNEEDLSSVLRFKSPGLARGDSINDSECSSSIIQLNRRFKKGSSKKQRSVRINCKRIEEIKSEARPHNHIPPTAIKQKCEEVVCEKLIRDRDHWVVSMRRKVARALETTRFTTTFRQRSISESSTSSSSGENEEECVRKAASPTTPPKNNEPKHLLAVAGQSSSSLLSPHPVQRKASTFSTVTRERMINSIFSPITFFSKSRKQTKAEKRAHKAFRTITFIVGCFAILWSPYYVMATIYGFCKGECIPSILYSLSYYMCYLNSSGNPFAYALANRQFRTAFTRMLKGNFNRIR